MTDEKISTCDRCGESFVDSRDKDKQDNLCPSCKLDMWEEFNRQWDSMED